MAGRGGARAGVGRCCAGGGRARAWGEGAAEICGRLMRHGRGVARPDSARPSPDSRVVVMLSSAAFMPLAAHVDTAKRAREPIRGGPCTR